MRRHRARGGADLPGRDGTDHEVGFGHCALRVYRRVHAESPGGELWATRGLSKLEVPRRDAFRMSAQVRSERLPYLAEPEQADARVHVRLQIAPGTNTSPRRSLRAVRNNMARRTTMLCATSTSTSTVKNPVGCSTSMRGPEASPRRTSCEATVPGIAQAVATLTAPNTPMASCTRCGMNVAVAIEPPLRGALTRHILGTVLRVTSPRFMRGPIFSRRSSTFATSAALAASCAGVSAPVTPSADARRMMTGMPLSMQVTSIPSTVSIRLPVGSSAPQLDPATSRNSSAIGAAAPGTPSMRVLPSYSTAPRGVGTSATAMLPVFTM